MTRSLQNLMRIREGEMRTTRIFCEDQQKHTREVMKFSLMDLKPVAEMKLCLLHGREQWML